MSGNVTYEQDVLNKARAKIDNDRFASLLSTIDREVSLADIGCPNNASRYIDQLKKEYCASSVWYLNISLPSSLNRTSPGYGSCSVMMLVLFDKFLSVVLLNGYKKNYHDLRQEPDKRRAWSSIPSINRKAFFVVPLSSITTSSGVRLSQSEVQHGDFVSTTVVDRKPNYVGAALVGGAVGGEIGAIAAMSYEASRSGKRTVSRYVKPWVTVNTTGNITFTITGPAIANERKTPPVVVNTISTAYGDAKTMSIAVPKRKGREYDGNYAGEYNARMEQLQHLSLNDVLKSLQAKADKEVRLAVAYDRRLEWFGIGIDEPLKFTDEQLGVICGDNLTEAYSSMLAARLREIDGELERLAKDEKDLRKKLKSADRFAKLFKKSGQEKLEAINRDLRKIETRRACLQELKEELSQKPGSPS